MTSQTCPNCHASLPPDAPAGLCPACLMSAGLPSQADLAATLLVDHPKPRGLPRLGEIFGGYRIESELGHGGMGAVYAAEHLETGRHVALKVLSHKLDSPEARARFLREGRLAASINHPNSVYVFGTEEIEGTPAISMELITGGTLQERVQRSGPLPVAEAVDAALQIIEGLEAAQVIGILHRDIKPANCFEDLNGTVKVGDFGLSISTAARGNSLHTIEGSFLGTPAFCSPEQLRGEEINVRSDMYSVGVTLFFLLTGRTPFEGKNVVQLLANALEKPAPSPSKFRPEIPQSLSRVVLRCLNKQATERFTSYDELRRALMPFNSTAPAPATLGLRFVAELVDMLLLAVANWSIMIPLLGDSDFMNPQSFNTARMLWISVGMIVMHLLYFAVLEGVWSASIGKALVGLRVARLNRGAPGFSRALARAFLLNWPNLVGLLIFKIAPFAAQDTALVWAGNAFSVVFFLAMFSTARRQNGFAALHDLWTGTRVIEKSAYQARAVIAASETIETTEALPKLGPYYVLAKLDETAAHEILLGYDAKLLRKVWIRKPKGGETSATTPALRNIARAGRLRWLQGGRDPGEPWDAYEAPSGQALLDLMAHRQPWSSVRNWLHDLAVEIEAGSPPLLALDRVWITSEGRAKLLDFSAPQSSSRRNLAVAASCEPRVFLNQVAISALQGRIATVEEASSNPVSAPLALRARAFMRDLITPSTGGNLANRLKPLLQEAPFVPWWKRLAIVLICGAPAVMTAVFMVLGVQIYQRWTQEQPELAPLMACLSMHHDLEQDRPLPSGSTLSIADAKSDMEILIAGRYGHIIRDAKAWSSPIYKAVIKQDLRAAAERIVAAHPKVGDEELKKAEAAVKPDLSGIDETRAKKIDMSKMSTIAIMMIGMFLSAIAVISLACALAFRRGPLFRILGIAVVSKDGAEASRLRMLARGLIAWSPILMCGIFTQCWVMGFAAARSSLTIFGILAALVIVPTLISLIGRERGLQDRIAGTWLVPQ